MTLEPGVLLYYNLVDETATKLSQYIYEGNWQPVWSPDRQQIAYVSDVGGLSRMFIFNADGKSASNA